jgi:hypothetical protein
MAQQEYHEHVAGDKHSHSFTGPHSHGGVSTLAPAASDDCEERIERLTTALRVASHEPHDRDGEPVEGFPTCSVCGAILTGPAASDGSLDVERLARALLRRVLQVDPIRRIGLQRCESSPNMFASETNDE